MPVFDTQEAPENLILNVKYNTEEIICSTQIIMTREYIYTFDRSKNNPCATLGLIYTKGIKSQEFLSAHGCKGNV